MPQQDEGMGPQGACICLKCGHRQPHEPGEPCRARSCPRCGATLIREGSAHHRTYLEKQAAKKRGDEGD